MHKFDEVMECKLTAIEEAKSYLTSIGRMK